MKAFFLIVVTLFPIAPLRAESVGDTKTPAEHSTPPPVNRVILYALPKGATPGKRVDGDGASRGGKEKLPSLYVLAPDHTGLTTRAQPSLFWYQSAPSKAPFQLTLVELDKPKPVLKLVMDRAEQAGIRRIRLARHQVTLIPGVCYRWTVALSPDPSNRSQDVVASGTIQRIEPDPKLTAAIALADDQSKALVYARHGLWYDALEAVTNRIDDAPKSRDPRLQRAMLLEEAGLKDAAAAERRSGTIQ